MHGEVVARGVSVFVANVHPWSYVGPFALKLAPRATFEGGLDVVVPRDMRRRHLPRYATQLLVTGSQAYRTGPVARLPARRRRGACGLRPAPAAAHRRRRPRRRRGGRRSASCATPRGSSCDAAALRPRRHARRLARRRRAAVGGVVRAPRARLRRRARRPARRPQRPMSSAPSLPASTPRRRPRCSTPRRRPTRDGLEVVRGCARGCWRACRRAAGGSSRRAIASSREGRLHAVGLPVPRRDGVRRRGRGRQARSRGLPDRARGCSGRSPQACVVCEDAPAGIEAARAAGMRVIGITTTHAASALAGADVVVADLTEFDARCASRALRRPFVAPR